MTDDDDKSSVPPRKVSGVRNTLNSVLRQFRILPRLISCTSPHHQEQYTMAITTAMEGQTVPDCSFMARKDGNWHKLSTKEIFLNRTIVLFSLPGAFTPTCSSAHVPRYNELAPLFKENGVDEIICVSVNDGFVMESWQRDQKAYGITFVPDGNGEFTDKMGFLVDKSIIGFGKRSWRYSALIKNGVITKLFPEPERTGDPFETSDADTMLNFINPNVVHPDDITMFSKPGCGFCERARTLLSQNNVVFEEIMLGTDTNLRGMRSITGASTTPQIFINAQLIGGYDELIKRFPRVD